MASKVKVTMIAGKTAEERYANSIEYIKSLKMGSLANVAIESKTGTMAVLPKDGAERKLLGAYAGQGDQLSKLVSEVFRKYSLDTVLQIDDKNYNTDPGTRAKFRERAAEIGNGAKQEESMTDEVTTTEPTEEEQLEANITADLEALGEEVAVDTKEAGDKGTPPEAKPDKPAKKAKAAKEPKPAKESKEAKPKTLKHFETGLVIYKGVEVAACRICGKALTQETSVKRGVGPVCWAAIQGALNLTDEQVAALANPELTSDEEFAKKLAEARAILNAKSELTEPPEGYVKLADVTRQCQEVEIPVSRWIKAFGGDRNAHEPENEAFAPVYVGRTRYVPGNAFEVLASVVAAEGEKKRELVGAAKAAKEAAEAKRKAKAAEATNEAA